LDATKFDIEGLKDFVERYDEYSEDMDALFAFLKNNFEFYFLPNG
jgi:hypothetical protein